MKRLVQLLILLVLSKSVFCQDTPDGMTGEQIEDWLTIVISADKHERLRLVKERFFKNPTKDKLDLPLLIIDGTPIDISNAQREFLDGQLTPDKVEIKVIDKGPEGLYMNKPFTGIVAIVITDRKTSRKFKKLR